MYRYPFRSFAVSSGRQPGVSSAFDADVAAGDVKRVHALVTGPKGQRLIATVESALQRRAVMVYADETTLLRQGLICEERATVAEAIAYAQQEVAA